MKPDVPRSGFAVRRPNQSCEENAADWFARRETGFAAGEEARFQTWLAADPQHATAFAELERAWEKLNRPRHTGRADEVRRELRERGRRRGRRRLAIGFSALGVAMVSLLTFALRPFSPPTSVVAPQTTAVLRPNVQILADGSRVELNAGAEIVAEFSPARRDVRLIRGEVLFTVTKNAQRPFIVTAAGVEVRAVGTEFSVHLGSEQINVLVTEGRVALDRVAESEGRGPSATAPAMDGDVETVGAGELARMPLTPERAATQRKLLAPAEIAAALAWRGKRIEFSGTPLAHAAAMFNRQNRVQLAMADSATGELKITGMAWTNDPEGFVRLMETGLDLQSERSGDTITLGPIVYSEKSR